MWHIARNWKQLTIGQFRSFADFPELFTDYLGQARCRSVITGNLKKFLIRDKTVVRLYYFTIGVFCGASVDFLFIGQAGRRLLHLTKLMAIDIQFKFICVWACTHLSNPKLICLRDHKVD